MIAPKLRFSEFKDEFKTYQIRDIAKIYVGRDLVESSYSPIKTEKHIYPVYSNSVDNQGLYGFYDFEEHKFDDNALTVVGRGIGLGTAFYRIGAFGTIGRLLCLTPINQMFHPKYLADYINDKVVIHHESGGIPQLPRSSLENYHVILPTFKEQTKIAEFLSAVDDKISQLSRQLELLNQYKKGVMQKIFSQEIRFKNDNGEDFGEWKYLKLNEIAIKKSSKISANQIQDDRGDFTIFGASGYLKSISFFTEEEDYIAVVKDGAGAGRLFLMPKNSSVLSTMDIIRNNSLVNLDYLFYRLNKIDFNSYVKGSTIPHVYFKDYSEETIEVPTIQEQEKIAEFLTAIDERIDHTTAQLTQTKQWKKGLLQQMFV